MSAAALNALVDVGAIVMWETRETTKYCGDGVTQRWYYAYAITNAKQHIGSSECPTAHGASESLIGALKREGMWTSNATKVGRTTVVSGTVT